MYTIDDITQKTGLSRRALQEYDKMGLCSPSERGNLWKYSEEQLQLLSVLAILKMAGIQRKEMKRLMDEIQTQEDLLQIMDGAKERILQKKQEIDSALLMISSMRRQIEILDIDIQAMMSRPDDYDNILKTQADLEDVREMIAKEPGIIQSFLALPITNDVKIELRTIEYIMRIAGYCSHNPDDGKVQEIVEELCKYDLVEILKIKTGELKFQEIMEQNAAEIDKVASSAGYLMTKEFFKSEKRTALIKKLFGETAPEFVMAALRYHYNKFEHDEKEEEEMFQDG